MKLFELIHDLPVHVIVGNVDVDVTYVIDDSRCVRDGALFVARAGTQMDGQSFVADAIRRGAVAVLSTEMAEAESSVVQMQTDDPARLLGMLAHRLEDSPSTRMRVIGITGTNGKTTTAYMIRHLLNRNGMKCGMMGTVEWDDGAQARPASLTTPPATDIAMWMARMVTNGCRACVMEVSSHALQQQRTAGIAFDVAVFTNLSGDHLDYHNSMEAYAGAKVVLFRSLTSDGVAVVNVDDAAAPGMIEQTNARVLSCSMHSESDCVASVHETSIDGTHINLQGGDWAIDVRLPLIGQYNVMNALQAAVVAKSAGMDDESLADAFESMPCVPGRLERVTDRSSPFSVFVDYAHTDDALHNVLSALRPLVKRPARLIVVFGCGGDRDTTKRPRMARAACDLADCVYVTSDNPRTEDPQAIVDEILTGVPAEAQDQISPIVSRRDAIGAAIESARAGDVVLIAGKGHEDYQIIGSTRQIFDDRIVAREALASLQSGVLAS